MSGVSVNRVLRAWGANPPDWIVALAKRCDETSQGKVARELGISAPVVNQLLGRTYKGNVDDKEQKVRGRFMKAVVECPVLGEISTADCATYQRRKFRPINPTRVSLHIACQSCPNNREKKCAS